MRRVEMKLSDQDRAVVDAFRRKGQHPSREVNRAHILASLDAGLPIQQIIAVLGVTRVSVWRTCATYLKHGLEKALFDDVRSTSVKRKGAAMDAAAAHGATQVEDDEDDFDEEENRPALRTMRVGVAVPSAMAH